MNNDYPIFFEGSKRPAPDDRYIYEHSQGLQGLPQQPLQGLQQPLQQPPQGLPQQPLQQQFQPFDPTQSLLFDPSINGQSLQDLYQDKPGLFDYPKPPSPPPAHSVSPPKVVKRRRCRAMEDSRTVNNWEDLSLKEGYKSFLSTAMKLNITTGVAWTSLDAALLDIWCFNQFVLKKWVEYRNKGTANGINYLCRHCKGYKIRIHMFPKELYNKCTVTQYSPHDPDCTAPRHPPVDMEASSKTVNKARDLNNSTAPPTKAKRPERLPRFSVLYPMYFFIYAVRDKDGKVVSTKTQEGAKVLKMAFYGKEVLDDDPGMNSRLDRSAGDIFHLYQKLGIRNSSEMFDLLVPLLVYLQYVNRDSYSSVLVSSAERGVYQIGHETPKEAFVLNPPVVRAPPKPYYHLDPKVRAYWESQMGPLHSDAELCRFYGCNPRTYQFKNTSVKDGEEMYEPTGGTPTLNLKNFQSWEEEKGKRANTQFDEDFFEKFLAESFSGDKEKHLNHVYSSRAGRLDESAPPETTIEESFDIARLQQVIESYLGNTSKTEDEKLTVEGLFCSTGSVKNYIFASKSVFVLASMRLNCLLDGSKYTLLSARMIDGDDVVLTVAFAIVQTDGYKHWKYFLSNMKECFSDYFLSHRAVTFMCTFNSALEQAASEVFPEAQLCVGPRDLCARVAEYIPVESRTDFNLKFWAAATDYNPDRVLTVYHQMLELLPSANNDPEYLELVRKLHELPCWTDAFAKQRKFGTVDLFCGLSVNDVRSLMTYPIFVFVFCAHRIVDASLMESKTTGEADPVDGDPLGNVLLPAPHARLMAIATCSKYYEVSAINGDTVAVHKMYIPPSQFGEFAQAHLEAFVVGSLTAAQLRRAGFIMQDSDFRVDLVERTCTCGLFQNSFMPCSHAYTAILAKGYSVFEFIGPHYYRHNCKLWLKQSDCTRAAFSTLMRGVLCCKRAIAERSQTKFQVPPWFEIRQRGRPKNAGKLLPSIEGFNISH